MMLTRTMALALTLLGALLAIGYSIPVFAQTGGCRLEITVSPGSTMSCHYEDCGPDADCVLYMGTAVVESEDPLVFYQEVYCMCDNDAGHRESSGVVNGIPVYTGIGFSYAPGVECQMRLRLYNDGTIVKKCHKVNCPGTCPAPSASGGIYVCPCQ